MSKNSMTDETAYLYSNYNIVFLKDNSIEDLLNIKIWINYIENIYKCKKRYIINIDYYINEGR